MRHGKKVNHLGRKTAHRHALLSNMASSLILNKRITTTVAKAKALRKYVEPLITKSKDDTTHSRRVVMSYLQNKESLKSLFGEVASRVSERQGGYTRIIKIGEARLGDGSEMCMMELVDFNDVYKKDSATKKAKTRRSRKGKKGEGEVEVAAAEEPKAEAAEKKPKKAKSKKEKK
jgi:large subunit ribosomal protein L17